MEFNAAQWGGGDGGITNSDFPGRLFLPDSIRRIRQVFGHRREKDNPGEASPRCDLQI
jgi:hypothetical protein